MDLSQSLKEVQQLVDEHLPERSEDLQTIIAELEEKLAFDDEATHVTLVVASERDQTMFKIALRSKETWKRLGDYLGVFKNRKLEDRYRLWQRTPHYGSEMIGVAPCDLHFNYKLSFTITTDEIEETIERKREPRRKDERIEFEDYVLRVYNQHLCIYEKQPGSSSNSDSESDY